MTIAQWLVDSMLKLQDAEVPNGRRDCIILLADLFNKDKSWVHTHPDHDLDDLQVRELDYKLKKRAGRTPLAYIRGFSDFYGRRFTVNSRVLIPRPESESFISILKDLEIEVPRIADIGSGSGCLGITAALEIPDAIVHLYDVDPFTLAIAHHNARIYGLHLEYFESNLLESIQFEQYDVILANLPYVPNDLLTSPEIEKEPALALFSGKDGLNHYRAFWSQIQTIPSIPRFVLTESLEEQHEAVAEYALQAGYKLAQTDLLVQLFSRET